jgi:hypothetical protein
VSSNRGRLRPLPSKVRVVQFGKRTGRCINPNMPNKGQSLKGSERANL